jgi:hypothetical protein
MKIQNRLHAVSIPISVLALVAAVYVAARPLPAPSVATDAHNDAAIAELQKQGRQNAAGIRAVDSTVMTLQVDEAKRAKAIAELEKKLATQPGGDDLRVGRILAQLRAVDGDLTLIFNRLELRGSP